MEEIWKDIDGYEGSYQVSNLGNVRSLDMKVWNGKKYYDKPGRILKKIMFGNYHGVQLKNKKFYVHRLVARAFIENNYNKKEVNHIDGNKYNNAAVNLEWSTRQENEKHAIKTGLKNSVGENNPMCTIPDETVKKIRKLYQTGKYKQSELAEMFNISRMQTNRIVRNLLRKEVI